MDRISDIVRQFDRSILLEKARKRPAQRGRTTKEVVYDTP